MVTKILQTTIFSLSKDIKLKLKLFPQISTSNLLPLHWTLNVSEEFHVDKIEWDFEVKCFRLNIISTQYACLKAVPGAEI